MFIVSFSLAIRQLLLPAMVLVTSCRVPLLDQSPVVPILPGARRPTEEAYEM